MSEEGREVEEWQQREAITEAVGGLAMMMREQSPDCQIVEAEVSEEGRDGGLLCGGEHGEPAHLSSP